MAYPRKTERNKEILKKRKKGWSYRQIGREYNLKSSTVYNIVKRDTLALVDKVLDKR